MSTISKNHEDPPPIGNLLIRLWSNISRRHRWQFFLVFLFMLLTAFCEIISIGAVLPFLSILTAPSGLQEGSPAYLFIQKIGLVKSPDILLLLTIAFIVAAVISGMMRMILLWVNSRLSYAAGADLSQNIYKRTLYQPYSVHLGRNSSQVISGISSKADGVIASIISPCLVLLSSSLMGIFILASLFYIDPIVATIVFATFSIIYISIFLIVKKRVLVYSKCIAHESTQVIKSLQEGLGGIRDVLIDGTQALYCRIYSNADKPLRKAQGNILFITQSPRYLIEALGIILIAVLAYFLSQKTDGSLNAIPVLGALALGSQKLLPIMQQTYSSWTSIQAGRASLSEVLQLLEQPLTVQLEAINLVPLTFEREIRLENITFSYNKSTPLVLNNISIKINKGSRVGFMGKTGSGKSTLLDVVMGLLEPNTGTLQIDGQIVNSENNRAWQSNIAHVPQSIYLIDGTIEENIAFGVPRDAIDSDLVRRVAIEAQIAGAINLLPEGYGTLVGERGVRLSGGQRQRIGIARALYKQAKVIIFDEATSALDVDTEKAVMESIDKLSNDLTLLIVAHRLSTLNYCSEIVRLDSGCVVGVGSFSEMVQGGSRLNV